MKFIIKHDNLSRIEKIELTISRILKLFILGLLITSIIRGRSFLIFSSSLILMVSLWPAIVERNFKINLPIEIDFIVTLFLWSAFVLGEVNSFYDNYPWWDLFLHSLSGIILGIFGFIIVYTLFFTHKIKANPYFVAVFSIAFAISIGVFWEIFEFSFDQLFGTNMQKSGLVDTMWDLIVDALGALMIGMMGYFYVKRPKKGFFDWIIRKFISLNKGKF